DTVGFINKLPHSFVDAFKSTLEEVKSADLLLHVVDAASPQLEEQRAVVERVLGELGADAKPRLTVFNKIDQMGADQALPVLSSPSCAVSAMQRQGIELLVEKIDDVLRADRQRLHIELPIGRGDLLARLHRTGKVLSEDYHDGSVEVTALV